MSRPWQARPHQPCVAVVHQPDAQTSSGITGVAPRVAVAEVGRCVGDAVADVFVEQADRDVLQEVTSGDQNKARDMVTEATQAIARIIKT